MSECREQKEKRLGGIQQESRRFGKKLFCVIDGWLESRHSQDTTRTQLTQRDAQRHYFALISILAKRHIVGVLALCGNGLCLMCVGVWVLPSVYVLLPLPTYLQVE